MAPLNCILPPYLLRHLAEHGDEQTRNAARSTLERDQPRHDPMTFAAEAAKPKPSNGPAGHPVRTIFDCRQTTDTTKAVLVRDENAAPTKDLEVDEAYEGLGATYKLYWDAYGRNSIDNRGLHLNAYVHYDTDYDNAFWDGSEMIFGDGHGTTFNRFTIAVDVIGHELTHGVTQYQSNLNYQDQSGALNESVSDVFGSLVKQYALGQSAADADWLIGAGLLKNKRDLALRSMKAPGTAYNDPVLGKDPQPSTMSDYVDTDDDNGGVHLNSGIPNLAFYLAAVGIGGNAWQGAGKVWYNALVDSKLKADTNFAAFAKATLDHAKILYGAKAKEVSAIHEAWETVGVIK